MFSSRKKKNKEQNPSNHEPKGVKIADYSDCKDRMVYNKNAFEKIVQDNEVGDLPVVILAVSGKFRTGKSFLLNWFVDYLAKKEKGLSSQLNDVPQNLTCFNWKCGEDRETSGIVVCDKIFKITEKSKNIAVILMDTQGVFDELSSEKECKTIFSIGTLLSSIQVYNIIRFGYDMLKHLDDFLAYGKFFIENYDSKPFQNLQFLIRDWCSPREFSYGKDGGNKYLYEKWLQPRPRSRDTVKHYREVLGSCFEKVNCYLMPYPGREVEMNGILDNIDTEFISKMNSFVVMTLKNLDKKVKTVNGEVVACKEIPSILEDYVTVYSTEDVPDQTTPVQANAEFYYRKKIAECLDYYDKVFKNTEHYNKNDDAKLKNVHDKLKENTRRMFVNSRQIDKEIKNKYEKLLIDDLGKRLSEHTKQLKNEYLEQINRKNQVENELDSEITRLLNEYDRRMENLCSKKVNSTELLEKEHNLIKKEIENEFKEICQTIEINEPKNEFLLKNTFLMNIKAIKKNKLSDALNTKLQHFKKLLDSDRQKIKAAYQTAEQDLQSIVEILYLKYEQEFQKKFDFKSVQSSFDLTNISDSITSLIFSNFKEQTSKYKNKTISHNFSLNSVDYYDLIANSENKLVKKINDNLIFYKKEVENKTVAFSKDFIEARNKSNKMVEEIYLRYEKRMENINERILKTCDLNKLSYFEKEDASCFFKQICETELKYYEQILDYKRQNELKQHFSDCTTRLMLRIDNQIEVYKSKLTKELKEYDVVCSNISNYYSESKDSCLAFFSRQFKRYSVKKLEKDSAGCASENETGKLHKTVLRILDFAKVLEYKTITKFNAQSFKLNHDSTSFDFNVLIQIQHHEKLTKAKYETSLRNSLFRQWREEAYEKMYFVFDKTLTWEFKSTEVFIKELVEDHFPDFEFEE